MNVGGSHDSRFILSIEEPGRKLTVYAQPWGVVATERGLGTQLPPTDTGNTDDYGIFWRIQ